MMRAPRAPGSPPGVFACLRPKGFPCHSMAPPCCTATRSVQLVCAYRPPCGYAGCKLYGTLQKQVWQGVLWRAT